MMTGERRSYSEVTSRMLQAFVWLSSQKWRRRRDVTPLHTIFILIHHESSTEIHHHLPFFFALQEESYDMKSHDTLLLLFTHLEVPRHAPPTHHHHHNHTHGEPNGENASASAPNVATDGQVHLHHGQQRRRQRRRRRRRG